MSDWRDFAAGAEKWVAWELRSRGWNVVMRPQIGALRPDIVVTGPDGQTYVLEVKVSPVAHSASFSDLAQVSSYVSDVRKSAHMANARPVVVTNLEVSPAMLDLSRALGVDVVSLQGSPQQLGHAVVRSLEPRSGEAPLTILVTDVLLSSAMKLPWGGEARKLLDVHKRIVDEAVVAHGGSSITYTGDGALAFFVSASQALECAIAMQRAFATYNESADKSISVRIGLNAGESIAEEEDLLGTAATLAVRIAAKAEGGEILTSDTVRGLAAGKGFLFADRGDIALRGFEDPVRLYEVSWREEE